MSSNPKQHGTIDETKITEISIAPDGRVYLFGLSREVLELFSALQPDEPKLRHLIEHLRNLTSEKSQQPVLEVIE